MQKLGKYFRDFVMLDHDRDQLQLDRIFRDICGNKRTTFLPLGTLACCESNAHMSKLVNMKGSKLNIFR